jgi:hypothetical protein
LQAFELLVIGHLFVAISGETVGDGFPERPLCGLDG